MDFSKSSDLPAFLAKSYLLLFIAFTYNTIYFAHFQLQKVYKHVNTALSTTLIVAWRLKKRFNANNASSYLFKA